MKISLKKISKRFTLAMMVAGIAGSGATMAAFAAIPDSNTGVVSACLTTLTGTLRLINAQTGATCTGLETPLSWDSYDRHSALAHFDVDPDDSTSIVFDASLSRNITQANIVASPNDGDTNRYICMQISFDPQVTYTTQNQTSGLGSSSYSVNNVVLDTQGSNAVATINYYCGSGNGYNAMATDNTTLSSAVPASVSFSD